MSQLRSQAFIAVSISLAVFFYGGPTQLFQLGVMTCLLVGLVFSVFSSINAGKITWSHVHTGLAVYSAAVLVNLYTSLLPGNSQLLVGLFLFLPMIVLMLERIETEDWQRLLFYISLPLSLSAFWGVIEFLSTTGRASGPVIDPNSWASNMNLAFFMFAAWFVSAPRRTAAWLLPLLALLATASFMSYSRVGLVIFFAALIFVSALGLTQRQWRRRAALLLGVCLISFASVQGYKDSETATRNTEGYTLNAESYGWTIRFAQWNSAVKQYADYPVFGSGLGTFKVLYPQYRTLDDQSTAGNYVHNDYLQLLAETGPLIPLLIVSLLAYLLFRLFISVKRLLFDSATAADKDSELELVILITAFGTVFVHSLMNFSFYMLLNQLLLGCILTRIISLLDISIDVAVQNIRAGLVKTGVTMVALYSLATNYADAISHDLVYRGGVLPFDRQNPEDQRLVFELLSTVRSVRGNNPANRFAMATFYRASFDEQPLENEQGRRSLAIATALEYESGLKLNPYAFDVRSFYAEFLAANPWLMALEEINQSPVLLLREGVRLTPLRIKSHLYLAEYLERIGQGDEAYAILKSALPFTQLKYDNHLVWRLQLQKALFRGAKLRQDKKTLSRLLATL